MSLKNENTQIVPFKEKAISHFKETALLKKKSDSWMKKIKGFFIRDQKSYETAVELHRGMISLIAEISGTFEESIKLWSRGHKHEINLKKIALGDLPAAEVKMRERIAEYDIVQMKNRQRNLDQAATELARSEEMKRNEKAGKAAAAGAPKKVVEGIRKEFRPIPVPIVSLASSQFKRAEGYSAPKERYSVEVVDFRELAKAAIAGKVEISFIQENQSALDKHAAAVETAFSIPGCRLLVTNSIKVRREND